MIPDNVEKIIMTKEDYDRNVEQLLFDKCKVELEVDRLNNIINELEKCLEKELEEGRPKDHLWLMGYYDASKDYLDKLKELKEENK